MSCGATATKGKQMTTITIKAHVYAESKHDGGHRFNAYGFKSESGAFGVYVGPVEFAYDVPAGWNPVAAEVAALEAEKAQAMADYQATVARINERMSKLLALTNEVAE